MNTWPNGSKPSLRRKGVVLAVSNASWVVMVTMLLHEDEGYAFSEKTESRPTTEAVESPWR